MCQSAYTMLLGALNVYIKPCFGYVGLIVP
jgi:hypothetical protein